MVDLQALPGTVLYVAGTDTGVGKTRVATGLCRALRARGLSVGVFKPAESGCSDLSSPADALALVEASGCSAPLEVVCPYRFVEPIAPGVAAERVGVNLDLSRLHDHLEQLRDSHDVVVCEGAGGLLVPFAGELLNIDWIALEHLPVLLVGRLGLGTINHTLLSARCLEQRHLPLLATVLSAVEPLTGVSEQTNPAVLSRYPEVRLAGVVDHCARELPESVTARIIRALARDRYDS